MFLVLDRANRYLDDPQFKWCIVAGDLANDEEFNPAKPGKENQNRHKRRRQMPEPGSERAIVEAVMSEANRQLGNRREDPFYFLYLRICQVGITGYEYSQSNLAILLHALHVAAILQQPLHVHRDLAPALSETAYKFGWQTECKPAEPILITTHLPSTQKLNAAIRDEELMRLTMDFRDVNY